MLLTDIVSAVLDELPDRALPDPDELSYYVLEKERKLYLDYDVCLGITSIQRMIMRWNMEDLNVKPEERKPIWLYIMSYGGDIQYMWMLIDAIEASETPVYTVNLNMAGSAASLIYLAGHKRFMMKNSQLVVHEGYAELSGDAIKVMDASENYKKDLRKMKEFIEAKTNIPRNIIMKKRNNDWYLDADYCKENGACDHIVSKLSEICV